VHGEAKRRQLRFQAIEYEARRGRNAGTGDQRFGKVGDGLLHMRVGIWSMPTRNKAEETPMPKVDLESISQNNVTGYPAPFDAEVAGRWKRRLGPLFGLEHLGACHVVLKPGAWSSQRHWHDTEDELVVMLSGEAVLVEDSDNDAGGRTLLRAGDICVWPAGDSNGHHLRNESEADCCFLALSAGPLGGGGYSDIDMVFTEDGRYTRRDGTAYGANRL
jgi:uncharacterized cupin superfamily protein